jgi:glycosyltransferase involved in cell wall biosynthesis
MVAELIPSNNIYIFEGSLHPNWTILDKLKNRFNVKVVLVPYLRFGAVRNLIMLTCKSDFVAMVDDDIQLEKDWFKVLMNEFADSKVVAVSSKLIFGDGVVAKLCWANKRTSGGSGGAAIYDRKAILELGNFNEKIHRGEDVELELRILNVGKKWVKSQKTRAYHPLTILEFLDRPKANVCGWDFIMKNSTCRVKFMLKRFASTFIMPVYYFWGTFDFRCAGLWLIYKMKALLYYLSGRYLNWS